MVERYTRAEASSKGRSSRSRARSPPRRARPVAQRQLGERPQRVPGGRHPEHTEAAAARRSRQPESPRPPPDSSLIAMPGPPGRTTAAQTAAPPIFAVSRAPATSSSAVSKRPGPSHEKGMRRHRVLSPPECRVRAARRQSRERSPSSGDAIGRQPAPVDAAGRGVEIDAEHLLRAAVTACWQGWPGSM